MNLHSVIDRTPAWIWFRLYGQAYRSIGVHLWFVERGTPPPAPTAPYSHGMRYHTPARYSWYPYQPSGPTPPALCGFRTRAMDPRREHTNSTTFGLCHACVLRTRERGILVRSLENLLLVDPEYRRIQEEWETWRSQY